MTTIRALLVAAVVLHAVAGAAASEIAIHGGRAYFVDPDGRAVKVRVVKSGEERDLFRAVSGRVSGFELAAASGFIAIGEGSLLRVLDSDGRPMAEIDDVRVFSWSPEGRRLAYVTQSTRGNWIWSAADGSRTEIGRLGYYLHWASFDGRIYVWEQTDGVARKVYAYDPRTRETQETPHKSIYFSPSGSYYFHPGDGPAAPEGVFARGWDVTLAASSRVLASLCGFQPIAWAPDADLLLMHACRKAPGAAAGQQFLVVYDPMRDIVLSVGAADAGAWGRDSSEIVVRNGARTTTRELPQIIR